MVRGLACPALALVLLAAPVAGQEIDGDELAWPLSDLQPAELPQDEALAGAPPAEEEPEEASEAVDLSRIRFEVPFPADKGGGVATGSAGALDYARPDYVIATGGVEVAFQAYRVQAERMEVDLAAKSLIAEGDVILDEGPRRLSGIRLEFDFGSETGTMYEAQAFVEPDLYFSGEEIEKTGENTFTVKHGMMTSCISDSPAWSFRLGKGRVNTEGYARASNVTVRAKKMPVLYWPYLIFPAERDRKSGFLFPNLGNSRTRGNVLSLAYYQVLGRSYDATLYADIFAKDYLGLGTELRYHPTVGSRGVLEGYAIDDPLADDVRWKASINHASDDLPFGMRGVIRATEFSDFDFFRDFERDFNDVSVRTINSTGYMTGNWGNHSFNLMLQKNETFIRQGITVDQRQLPEIEYRLRSTQLGSLPLYFQMDTSAHYFQAARTGVFDEEWQRADVSPRLTAPLSYWPWLSLSVSGGGRVTWYSNSLDAATRQFSGDALTRVFPVGGAEVVGPSFSKIFDWKVGRFGKFKHIVEPRIAYSFVGEFDDQELVPLFDEIDTLRNQNFYTVGIVNRLLAKPADPDALEGAREIASFELFQSFSLDEDQPFQRSRDRLTETTVGPILGRFRFNPGTKLNLESRFTFNTLFDRIQDSSLSGSWSLRQHGVGLTWFTRFDPETGDTTSHQARLSTQVTLWPNRVRLGTQINYDLALGLLQQIRNVLTYQAQCWGLVLEFRELRSLDRNERDFRFALSLKNVGTFLDLTGGNRRG